MYPELRSCSLETIFFKMVDVTFLEPIVAKFVGVKIEIYIFDSSLVKKIYNMGQFLRSRTNRTPFVLKTVSLSLETNNGSKLINHAISRQCFRTCKNITASQTSSSKYYNKIWNPSECFVALKHTSITMVCTTLTFISITNCTKFIGA